MTTNSPPPDYYLNYFQQMLSLVVERYGDLLTAEERFFIRAFETCSAAAKRLLVRLYLRKGPLFRVATLTYAEVDDCQIASNELCQNRLLEMDPQVHACDLINLLPIAVARKLFANNSSISKAKLREQWLEDDLVLHCHQWQVEEPIATPSHYDVIERLYLLYFGNSRQTLTEFILQDIGLFQYEKYSLDKTFRLFNSSGEVSTYLQLSHLKAELQYMNELKDWQELANLAQQVLALKPADALLDRWYRLLNRIGYRLEQCEELDLALQLFETNDQPPARERRVRILTKLGHYPQAFQLLEEIQATAQNSEEAQFCRRFGNKLRGKLALPKHILSPAKINEVHCRWPQGDGTVEQQACRHFPGSVWLENSLPNSIFGLIHWSIIFQDLPAVWHHPFQSAPTDLYDPDFSARRTTSLAQLHAASQAYWETLLIERWHQKRGIRNPFVHWEAVHLENLLTCFTALNHAQWLGIFHHLLADLKHHKTGFPDLFQYHQGVARFIEIKGPGDQLQDNQRDWLSVFGRLQIPADVCYVQFLEP